MTVGKQSDTFLILNQRAIAPFIPEIVGLFRGFQCGNWVVVDGSGAIPDKWMFVLAK